ncbi:MAG: ATP-binding protein [Candidatus Limnocylindrales bacterium]
MARRLSGRPHSAHYPLDKRLAHFEFDFQPSIDRAVIAELSTLRFVEECRNALFMDPRGWVRAILASALGIAACEGDFRTYFTTAVDLVAHLEAAHLEGAWTSNMRTYTGPLGPHHRRARLPPKL